MCGTDIREIPAGSLNIMVITGHACLVEPVKLISREKSHGSAQIDLTFLFHGLVSMDRFVKFLSCQCFSSSYNGKAIHAFGLIELAQLHDLFFRKKIIDFAIRVMMGRLCAVFTVFRTAAAAAVDDGAKVYFIANPCFTDLISSFT